MYLLNKKLSLKEIENGNRSLSGGNYRTFADASSSTNTCAENYHEMPDVSSWTRGNIKEREWVAHHKGKNLKEWNYKKKEERRKSLLID